MPSFLEDRSDPCGVRYYYGISMHLNNCVVVQHNQLNIECHGRVELVYEQIKLYIISTISYPLRVLSINIYQYDLCRRTRSLFCRFIHLVHLLCFIEFYGLLTTYTLA